ncbi:MAG: glycosyltransferase family 4 protein [Chloroflexota bacterium]|nr:MAG: glycosyltransferase family 4 protein [Chloroflexota bacterium]
MRILIISNYYPPFEMGGWGQLTRDVARRLARRGHSIHILTSKHRADQLADSESSITRMLNLESPDHIQYHPHYTLLRRWWEHQNKQLLAGLLAEFGPEVIFVNGMWNLPHSVASGAEQLCPGRVVYYMASTWPTDTDAHSSYWLDDNGDSWRRRMKRRAGRLVGRTLLPNGRRSDLDFRLVLCVSDYVQDHLIEHGGLDRAQTRVVHNGIDLTSFPKRNPNGNGKTLRFLYAGRLSPDKGVHTAVEGFKHALKAHPEFGATLSIVGAGAPAYEAQLKQSASALVDGGNVVFRGWVPYEQMPGLLYEHDVLLFPSIWQEPLARMVQEAMASGLVVVSTTTGGTPEILQDGQNGLTFEAGDAAMLAQKIVQLVREPALRPRLARAARQTVEEHFTLDRMVDEVEFYLNSVCEGQETILV